MAEDWFVDVRKHAADADEGVVGAIVRYLGIALRNRDSSLVSFNDPEEVGRVRERFLRKKLALTEPDDVLNEGLEWVRGIMSGDRTKNRVTVYYLLAHYFGKLDLFGGPSGTSANSFNAGPAAAGLAGLGAAGLAGAASAGTREPAAPIDEPLDEPVSVPPSAPLAAVPAEPTATTPVQPVESFADTTPPPPPPPPPEEPRRSYGAADLDDDGDRRGGWPSWLTWLLVIAALLLLFFLLRGCMAERAATPADTGASTEVGAPADVNLAGDANAALPAETSTAPVPTGAGVVTGTRDSRPMLTVYFDTGKSAVSNDFSAAAATLKGYLDANPGSKLAVSGYNDPTGNAAANAELSKNRAQAVAAALKAAGVPDAAVELVKPADTTSTEVTPEQARRVEVTVQ